MFYKEALKTVVEYILLKRILLKHVLLKCISSKEEDSERGEAIHAEKCNICKNNHVI